MTILLLGYKLASTRFTSTTTNKLATSNKSKSQNERIIELDCIFLPLYIYYILYLARSHLPYLFHSSRKLPKMHKAFFLVLLQGLSIFDSSGAFAPTTSTVQKPLIQQTKRTTGTHLNFFNFGKDSKDEKTEDVQPEEVKEEQPYSDDDPVEKMFNFFFGAKEEAPMGMARFGKDRFPEQYPAIKDAWADPVDSDDKDMQIIRPFLKNTNVEGRALKLSYDANRDGWDAIKFHQKCDKLGGAVVLCETRMGIVCGGYNPKGWVGYGEARGSIAAFLFLVGGKYAKEGAPGTKLQKVGQR